MSNSVDSRIVDMKFENNEFQRRIAASLKSLDDLKAKLSFQGEKRNIADLQRAGQQFTLDGMSKSLDGLAAKFQHLSVVGVAALATVVHKATEAGLALTNSLTLGPISEGFNDYNAKLTSVKTIMNATGESVDVVDSYFRELDVYADKTVYNLSDMTGAFAKFTNAGLDMDVSVPAIKGIANMTALAGQGADAAAIAMYNLSQSISGGFLTTPDFKSLNLANVATKEWKGHMIDAAVAAGTLEESSEGIYNIPGSDKAYNDAELFTQALSEGWATADVLTGVLADYGDTTTEIGQKAQDAAQKVKSLPMMMETLRASVGTQWTDTFELLFGNVDEATELFTGLTDAITPLIQASGEARNALLTDWKELGGRDEAIQAVKNAWQALSNVMAPIRDAFRDIFPRKTGQELFDLTVKIREFTEKLIAGEGTMKNIYRTFSGLFSVLKLGITIVKGFVGVLFKAFGAAGQGAGGFFAATAAIGDFLYMITSLIEKSRALDIFFAILASPFTAIAPLIGLISHLAKAVSALVSGDIQGFRDGMGEAFAYVGYYVDGIRTKIENFGTVVMEVLGAAQAYFTNFADKARSQGYTFIAVLAEAAAAVGGFLADAGGQGLGAILAIFTQLDDVFASVVDYIKGIKSEMNFDFDIAGMSFGGGAGDGALDKLGDFGSLLSAAWDGIISVLTSVTSTVGPIIGNIMSFFETLTRKITEYLEDSTMQDAVALFNTGVLIALYLSIKKFVDNISTSMDSIAGAFDQLSDTLSSMQKAVRAQIIMTIAIAVGILVGALLILTRIDPKALGYALGALTILFAQLAATLIVIEKNALENKGLASAGTSLVMMAGAIVLLASAMKIMSSMSWEELARGLVAVGVLLGALAIFTRISSADGAGFKAGVGLVLMASAIKILSQVLVELGTMDYEALKQGIISLGIIIGMLAAIIVVMNKAGIGIPSAAAGLVILAVALTMLLVPLNILAFMNFGLFIKGMSMLALMLVAVAGAMMLFPEDMMKIATGLLIASTAMVMLAGVVAVLGMLDYETLAKGMSAMAMTLGILVLALFAMEKTFLGSQAMLAAAAAMTLIAVALKLLAGIDPRALGIALLAVAAGFGILALAGWALTPVIPTLVALAGVLKLMALAMLIAGVAFGVFAVGFAAFAAVGAAGIAVAITAFQGFMSLIPFFMEQVGLGILAFAKVIRDGAPALATAFVSLLLAVLTAISESFSNILKTVGDMLLRLVEEVIRVAPKLANAGLELLIAFLKEIDSNIFRVAALGVSIMTAFIRGITSRLKPLIEAGVDLIIEFMEGVAESLERNEKRFEKAAEKLAEAILNGLIAGIKGSAKGVGKAMVEVAEDAFNAAKEWLGINSPARRFIPLGIGIDEGLALGINKYSGLVSDAAVDVGNSTLDVMKSTMARVGDAISGDVNFDPVITPVIDLTAFRKDAGAMASLLATDPVKTSVAMEHAASISDTGVSVDSQSVEPVIITRDVTFEQHNQSPKELSTIDVYRQTNNLFAQAERALQKSS